MAKRPDPTPDDVYDAAWASFDRLGPAASLVDVAEELRVDAATMRRLVGDEPALRRFYQRELDSELLCDLGIVARESSRDGQDYVGLIWDFWTMYTNDRFGNTQLDELPHERATFRAAAASLLSMLLGHGERAGHCQPSDVRAAAAFCIDWMDRHPFDPIRIPTHRTRTPSVPAGGHEGAVDASDAAKRRVGSMYLAFVVAISGPVGLSVDLVDATR